MSPEVTLCEGAARTRFQVPLERQRATFVGEFDDDVDDPGLAGSGMWTLARVMGVKP
jgi:hypothetical protein